MPPRLPLRCQLHDNSQQHVLKFSSRCRLGFSTSAAPKSADTSANINASRSGPYAEDEGQTWRMSADGKRKLPLPPILDPIAITQRERWIEPKKPAAAPADRTPFQKKLYNNAFAHMLSTPIREDNKLKLSLPTHFLVPFRPLKHPSTDDVWLLPGHNLKPTKAAGSFNAWAVARRAHLRALGTTKKKGKGAYRGLIGPEQAEALRQGSAKRHESTTWRADMDELVLRLLRENVVKQLRYGFGKPRGGGVLTRLRDDPGKGFVPYDGEETRRAGDDGEARSVPEQLSLHPAPAALLFLRSLTPLSAQPADALAQQITACDGLVDRLVLWKTRILQKFYPDYTPPPYSKWAYAEQLHPRLDPRIRVGKLRPSVVRWTPEAKPKTEPEASQETRLETKLEVKHSHLVPVYSLPDLLGGDDAVSALLGGERGERLWGRDAVLLKAGPGAIGAVLALERLRCYVEVPW